MIEELDSRSEEPSGCSEGQPGTGKRLQRHKQELKKLKDKKDEKCSRTKDKNEKRQIEKNYRELEQQLCTRFNAEIAFDQKDIAVKEVTEPFGEYRGLLYREKQLSRSQQAKIKKQILREEKMDLREAELNISDGSVEKAALQNMLRKEGFQLYEVPGDGSCFFRAVAHQLRIGNGEKQFSHEELRSLTSQHMLKNKAQLLPYVDNNITYEEYCKQLEDPATWCGEVEVVAMVRLLKRPIWIYTVGQDVIKHGLEYTSVPPIRLVFHRKLLSLGCHYNSVVELEQ